MTHEIRFYDDRDVTPFRKLAFGENARDTSEYYR